MPDSVNESGNVTTAEVRTSMVNDEQDATAKSGPAMQGEDLDDLDDFDFDLDEVENRIAPLALAAQYAGHDDIA